MNWDWDNDGWIVLAGVLSAVSAALLGNFLVLRRMSMLGDAISHAVLPGIAVAFLLTGSRHSAWMFAGAVLAGVLTAGLTQWIRDAGRVDEGAAMGVVFTSLFAAGLVLIVRAADRVDLDPGCVLYGNLVMVPLERSNPLPWWPQWQVPVVVQTMFWILLLNAGVVWLLFKELRLAAFDPSLSTTMGFPAWLLHYLLMTLVAVTAVASFESVGNILVVAMMVVPGAAATMITGRMAGMIWWSLLIAAGSAAAGHLMAIGLPVLAGWRSTSTTGMMAVAAGLMFGLAWLAGPRQGLLWRWLQRQRLASRIVQEDLLALLWRRGERATQPHALTAGEAAEMLRVSPRTAGRELRRLARRGLVEPDASGFVLSPEGENVAAGVVRSHRLWEQYLVERADMTPERIHPFAERLEHFTNQPLRDALDRSTGSDRDPHGAAIPPEPERS